MKNYKKYITAALLCGTMLISGCAADGGKAPEETAAPVNSGTESSVSDSGASSGAQISVSGTDFSYDKDYVRKTKPETASIEKSSTKGNIGDVTIEKGDVYAVIDVKDYGSIMVKLFPEEAPYAVQNFIDLALRGDYNGRNFHRILEGFMMQGGSADGTGRGGDSFEGGSFRNEINTSLRHFYGALCYASAMGSISDQFYIVNNKEEQPDIQMQYAYYAAAYKSNSDACLQYMEQFDKGSDGYMYYNMQYEFYRDSAVGAEAMEATCTDEVAEKYKKGGTPSLDGGYTVFGQTVSGFDVIDKISAAEVTTSASGENSQPIKNIIINSVTVHIAD